MSRFDQFQNLNGPRRLNRLVQVLLFAVFIFGLNQLSFTHYSRVHTAGPGLSSETLSRLRQLRTRQSQEKPVKVAFTVTISESSNVDGEPELCRHLRSLLADFEEHSKTPAGPLVTSTFLDPYRNRAEVDKLIGDYKLAEPQAVIVRSGERNCVLRLVDLVELKEGKTSGYKDEQALVSALLKVTSPDTQTIYFTTGHDEMKLTSSDPFRGLTTVSKNINQRNLATKDINLALERDIPTDAAAIIVPAPRTPFTPAEVDLLRRYLERAGRVIVLCDGTYPHGLDRLLSEWGLRTDDMVVVEISKSHLANGRDMLVSDFGDPHPVTQILLDYKAPVYAGISRPVRPDPSSRNPLVTLTPLLRSSDVAWGETGYREKNWGYNQDADLRGPVTLAYAAERRVSQRLGVNLRGGRLVVFGFGDLVTNLRMFNFGNQYLFQSILQWCAEDQPDLAAAPHPVEQVQLAASRDQLNRIAGLIAAVPGAVALLGLAVYWLRKS